ncbi:branched-chain amino acid ABC transporter substrate-binding protein [Streptomyces albireticuli]|uniref:Branched chain amino acid ABC transporter substrate-binding protein n=1 Tax=Streptomyces albireticuli TaxID=1940 RepID=A0A2A2D931_9ACTN|nr:branched-chain amino acid ABC transporter substrate-binding protein [Streptomyces albireticuli]MCD9142234.1 branched-chain amino acid ABC transporter substrate-binding protein [Streptomyces albireticuli]MCD9162512.1 branched-chain amino acid ABC transporter substrate-binding protein [Streptomyces albireticuli]MCD9190408.1 branched-chain amino acid ABC transporter substrate-binding protein [Streptomyces albireticuli]PAU48024.1 branched chain amino acid ABC transporter substrate-binding protei
MLILTTALTTGALTLSACGSRDDKGDDGKSEGKQTTVVIGLDAPLTGDLSALGQGIKNSAELALNNANKTKEVPGVTFRFRALDDQAQPTSGQQNATKLAGDKQVLGIVGPLNSSVAQSMQQVAQSNNIALISPANTTPDLSQGKDWKQDKRKRQFSTYFRTSTTDEVQGSFGGKYAYEQIKAKTVYVIDDQKTYGVGLAAAFTTKFTALGGKVVGTEHVNPEDRDFKAIVSKVKTASPDLVFYGGEYPASAPLSQQLKDGGVKAPLMGGDGMYSGDYITLNKKSAGDYATSVGKPVEQLDSAKKFIADYKTAGYKDRYEAYGGSTYDATWALVQAVKAVVSANDGKLPSDARAKIVDALNKVEFDGVTGPVSFDKYGDTTNTLITAYQVDAGQWKSRYSAEYKG